MSANGDTVNADLLRIQLDDARAQLLDARRDINELLGICLELKAANEEMTEALQAARAEADAYVEVIRLLAVPAVTDAQVRSRVAALKERIH